MKLARRTHVIIILALLAVNLAVKFSLWVQAPQTFPDSLGYIAPALRITDGLGYGMQENGFRTPTYPLFIAGILAPFDHKDLASCREARVPACLGEAQSLPGAEANLRSIVAVQVILGMAIILLVYWFAWFVSGSYWVAALCAFTYPIDLSTGYWEISILTDTLTTFLLALAVCLTFLLAKIERHRRLCGVLLGLVLGLLALAHSVFIIYAVIPSLFIVVDRTATFRKSGAGGWRKVLRSDVALVVLIPALAVLTWSARNYLVDGIFTPSTIAGYNLTQMVGPFMERAPAAYRDIAAIYMDYRAERIAARGNHSGTIFFAYRDILWERRTNWSGLSKELAAMSAQMIIENPAAYARVAAQSFGQFWKFGLGRQNAVLPISFDWVKWFLDTRVHEAWRVLFFVAPIALVLLHLSRRLEFSSSLWLWFAIATVFYAAIFSSLFNFGDNERYRTHVARLQYSAVIVTVYWIINRAPMPFRRKTTEQRFSESSN